MHDTPLMGPVALCTVIARDGATAVEAYTRWLKQEVALTGPLDPDTAASIGHAQLAGKQHWILANTLGRQWLQIVEAPEAAERDNLGTLGWLAMEVLVANVDELAAELESSPFDLLRPPANLDVSDRIRACQVRGPCGEILYLTQVSGEVPPFQLPRCKAPVDHLFIPVLSTPSRDDSLSQYSRISGNAGISFDTKITVVNQARGFDLERRHPVATLQLAGCALIEMDQIAETGKKPAGVTTGMACVAFHCQGDAEDNLRHCEQGPFAGQRTANFTGCAGERYTLVYS